MYRTAWSTNLSNDLHLLYSRSEYTMDLLSLQLHLSPELNEMVSCPLIDYIHCENQIQAHGEQQNLTKAGKFDSRIQWELIFE